MGDDQENLTSGANDPRPPLQSKRASKKSFVSNGRSLVTKTKIREKNISVDDKRTQSEYVEPRRVGDEDPPAKSTLFPNVVSYKQPAVGPCSEKLGKRRKPLYLRLIEEAEKQKQLEEQERNEVRIRRKLDLQKANFSLAAIREHIAKHDEIMAIKQKEYEQSSPLRRKNDQRKARMPSTSVDDTLPPLSYVPPLPEIAKDNDDGSVDTATSFISPGGVRKKRKKLKTKLNEKIKQDLLFEKAQRDKVKIDLEERMKKKEEFSEHVKKHKKPSPQKMMFPSGTTVDSKYAKSPRIDPLTKSPSNGNSSITALRVIENLDSLTVSQLQATPRGAPSPSHSKISPRASMGDLRHVRDTHLDAYLKLSPRLSEPALSLHLSENGDDSLSNDLAGPKGKLNRRPPKDSPVVTQLIEKYQYPEPAVRANNLVVADKPDFAVAGFPLNSPKQTGRASWVSELLLADPDEDNLAEIYEAGFSMYLVEKGISLED